MQKILLSWSGGKDSAMALHEIRQNPDLEVVALLTTITEEYDRISMHGVRCSLLEAQAAALGLPLEKILLTPGASNDQYETALRAILEKYRARGVTAVAFGDLFLEDLRQYREAKLAQVDMTGIFPLWTRETGELARKFLALGFRAIVTCADTQAGVGEFAGREFDAELLAELPAGCDPCFENGECHSFVYAGPIFREPIPVERGEIVLRDERFNYCDLLPASGCLV
jgi:uncharacterized protein (TIGR00290 family)